MIHQLEYTHEQYSAFLPEHGQCSKRKCNKGPNKGPGEHFYHKEPMQTEGECDFVVVGDYFVAVIEIKGLSFQDTEDGRNLTLTKFDRCYNSALTQRKRTKALMKSMDPQVMVHEFTVFPNISAEQIEGKYLFDETLNR